MSLHLRRRGKVYHADIHIKGMRVRVSTGQRDRSMALHQARAIAEQMQDNPPPPAAITLQSYITEYLAWAVTQKAATTMQMERSALRTFSLWLDRDPALSNIMVRDIDQYIAYLAVRGLKPISIATKIRVLGNTCLAAVRWGYIKDNPFRMARSPVGELPPPRILTLDEIGALMQATRDHEPEMFPVWVFYLFTGMRRAEAVRLEWSQVDFKAGLITLQRTKTKRPRYVPMVSIVRAVLNSRRDQERPFMLDPSTITHRFKRCAIAAGIQDISLNDLRRTFETYMLEATSIAAPIVHKILGHTAGVADRYYLGIPAETGEKMEQLVSRLTACDGFVTVGGE